ncbi:hypothetical protein F8S09_14970 [Deinococcus sp. SDU3-2]|uniref:HEAT repeat domain-containing protein n=1 Tax=Deinococcus terrestris TaxID=2651870 RepID=A0A7X1TSZ3_9DEIO|nr:hypothetical protein [Deinococcus terrestris]MPY67961.1 hypothetical protein [Deinococcus terrestris]
MRLFPAALLLGALLVPGAQARDLTPAERRTVASQVLTWPASAALPELPHLARAELGPHDVWLAALRPLPSQARRDAVMLSMPALARQGAVEVAHRALTLVDSGDRVRVWAISALPFLQARGSGVAVQVLGTLGTPVERVQALAILTQVAMSSPAPKTEVRAVADATWAAYGRLTPEERARLVPLIAPTVAVTGTLGRAQQLIPSLKDRQNQGRWLAVMEAFSQAGFPQAARQALDQLPLEGAEDFVRIRSALLLLKLGDARRAFQVAISAPLPWTMRGHLARELATAGHAAEAARLARTISPVSLRVQSLAELGGILAGQGQTDVARRLVEEARVALEGSGAPDSTSAVVRALARLGQISAADALIQGWRGRDPQGPDRLRGALVQGLAERGDLGEAIRRAQASPSLPTVYALVNGAEMRAKKGRQEQAGLLLMAALELSAKVPDEARRSVLATLARVSPSTLDTLATHTSLPGDTWVEVVEIRARKGDVAWAREALSRLPAEKHSLGAFTLARGLVEGGHADQALPLLRDPALRAAVARMLLGEDVPAR